MRTLATCLLLIYVSVSCRPVLPVLADGLAHLLWYQQHVETVHLHDGYAHVHNEIAQAAAEDSSEQGAAPSPAKSFKISDFVAAHVVAEILFVNIPFWDIQSAALPGSAPVLVGLYSKKVPVPPPNLTGAVPQQGSHLIALLVSLPTTASKTITTADIATTDQIFHHLFSLKTTRNHKSERPNNAPFTTHHSRRNGPGPLPNFLFFTYHFTVTV